LFPFILNCGTERGKEGKLRCRYSPFPFTWYK
jgi:hypothetical protein